MENPGHTAVSVTIYDQCELWQGPGLSMPQFPYREVHTQYLYQLRDTRHSLDVIMWYVIQTNVFPVHTAGRQPSPSSPRTSTYSRLL